MRLNRAPKWRKLYLFCLIVAGVLFLGFFISCMSDLRLIFDSCNVHVSGGKIAVFLPYQPYNRPPLPFIGMKWYGGFGVNAWMPGYVDNGSAHLFWLPLWIPFAIFSGTALLLHARARKPKPGTCAKCGYNLTGNVTGVCPECGTRT
jgi:hypothetical protein